MAPRTQKGDMLEPSRNDGQQTPRVYVCPCSGLRLMLHCSLGCSLDGRLCVWIDIDTSLDGPAPWDDFIKSST